MKSLPSAEHTWWYQSVAKSHSSWLENMHNLGIYIWIVAWKNHNRRNYINNHNNTRNQAHVFSHHQNYKIKVKNKMMLQLSYGSIGDWRRHCSITSYYSYDITSHSDEPNLKLWSLTFICREIEHCSIFFGFKPRWQPVINNDFLQIKIP